MRVSPLEQMVGRRLLIGITYLAEDGSVRDQLQFAGIVTAVEPLVSIEPGDGIEPFTLPPAEEAFDLAAPGEYRLRTTGEIVVDPDFITSWTVNPPDSKDQASDP